MPLPSSRAEAVAAADQLRRGLGDMSESGSLEEEMDLWNVRAASTLAHPLQWALANACLRTRPLCIPGVLVAT